MVLLGSLLIIALAVGAMFLFAQPPEQAESIETLVNSGPKALSARHCVFCGARLSLKSNKYLEQYLDFGNVLKGQVAGYIYPFCEQHDPIQLKSPLPEHLERVLSQGRQAILPHEESRSAQESVSRDAYVLAGQSIGQFSGNMWAATGLALAGALIGHLKNAPEKVQEMYTKNQDLLLRINLIEFKFLQASSEFLELDESIFKPLKICIDAVKTHLKVRLDLMRDLGDNPEYIKVVQDTVAAQKELKDIEDKFLQILRDRRGVISKRAASDERLVNGLNKLKQARMAGLLSEENYQHEVEALKKKEAG